MDEEEDAPINQSSDNIGASEEIMSDINTAPLEREGLSASNDDTDLEKTKGCTTLPSCFTIDDRSREIESLGGTSSKLQNKCAYFHLLHLDKPVLLFWEHFMDSDPC